MKKYIVLFCMGVLGACAADVTVPQTTPEDLYIKALHSFEKTDYPSAAKYFDEVERQHPYSKWAPRAQIMAAYSFYKKNEYQDAVLTLDRFIQLHPGNKNTPYAYYLKGLCYFEQVSDITREQKMSENAKRTFRDLLARYPNSIYAADAQAKLQILEDQLAGKEMAVGRYYEQQKEYLAALNRFQAVVTRFAHTNQVDEAYYRLTACYMALGMKQAAQMTALRQEALYPSTKWMKMTQQLIKKYGTKKGK